MKQRSGYEERNAGALRIPPFSLADTLIGAALLRTRIDPPTQEGVWMTTNGEA